MNGSTTRRRADGPRLLHLEAEELAAVEQLADGIAHHLNTPLQFIGDNLRFTGRGLSDLGRWLRAVDDLLEAARAGTVAPELVGRMDAVRKDTDVDYLLAELPVAIEQALEGVNRAAAVVDAVMADESGGGGG